MSLPWYYLERPARALLLRSYYAIAFFAYPTYVAINWNQYVPTRAEVLAGKSLRETIMNPKDVKK